jgi:protein-S-isoprenylcysteine O-methyltransferase Ste14
VTRLEVVRALVLLVPLAALVAALWRGPRTSRARGAVLLAGIAAFVGLGALHEVARRVGWWHYLDVAGAWRGFPVDLWIGWAIIWGALPAALARHVPVVVAVLGAAWVDVVAMPWLHPLVVLGEGWLVGEVVGLGVVMVPAVLLGHWCARRQRLVARATLQVVVFGGLVFWLLPTTVFTYGDGSWAHLLELPRAAQVMLGQVALLLALPGVAAVSELVTRGGGTPYPWDGPNRLVTSGPYAYVANPMQLSGTLLILLLAAVTRSILLAGAALAAVAFVATVADPHEREQLRARVGAAAFDRYRGAVRSWLPTWRPHVERAATLYVAEGCSLCGQLAEVVARTGARGLDIGDAWTHPSRPRRALYASGDGATATGVAAVARTLEHRNLGAAMLGWFVRLPLLAPTLQLVTDVVVPPASPPLERQP